MKNWINLTLTALCLSLFTHCYAANIAVVSMAIGDKYQEAVAIGQKNKKKYCKLHGHDFYYGKKNLDPSRPPAWAKILLIQKIMDSGKYDWIFWTDADSLFTNHTVKLESLIDENYSFIVSGEHGINTGQFLIKNCQWSRDFLKRVYNNEPFINHYLWENGAIIYEYDNNIENAQIQIKRIPQRQINSFAVEVLDKFGLPHNELCVFQRGDFIIHFAGNGFNGLEKLMNQYYQFVVYE